MSWSAVRAAMDEGQKKQEKVRFFILVILVGWLCLFQSYSDEKYLHFGSTDWLDIIFVKRVESEVK